MSQSMFWWYIWFEKAKDIDTSTFLTDTYVKSYKIRMFKLNSLLGNECVEYHNQFKLCLNTQESVWERVTRLLCVYIICENQLGLTLVDIWGLGLRCVCVCLQNITFILSEIFMRA